MNLRLANIVETAINPALRLLPPHMDTKKARVMMLGAGYQESKFTASRQYGNGPARSFWMFELGSPNPRAGMWALFTHSAAVEPLRLLCRERACNFDPRAIWSQIERDDVLAAGCARLLLWCDAAPLPEPGDEKAAYKCYDRCWNPGKKRPKDWPESYQRAMDEVFPPTPTP